MVSAVWEVRQVVDGPTMHVHVDVDGRSHLLTREDAEHLAADLWDVSREPDQCRTDGCDWYATEADGRCPVCHGQAEAVSDRVRGGWAQ